MINKVFIVGRLVNDPILKETKLTGSKRATFSLMIARGKRKDLKDFVTCVAIGKSADLVKSFCKKGDLIAIDGSIRSEYYVNKNAERRYVTYVLIYMFEFLAANNYDPRKRYDCEYASSISKEIPEEDDTEITPKIDKFNPAEAFEDDEIKF